VRSSGFVHFRYAQFLERTAHVISVRGSHPAWYSSARIWLSKLVWTDIEEIAKISIDRFAEQLGKAEAVLFWQHLDETRRQSQLVLSWTTSPVCTNSQ
jgi:hypothetical protein